ncbi:CCS [Bugula neritina]|uniref:Superoxide dismutase copper chaperone n=1 Tax=Bugula neritina TaxID=10212 RepID=A0A7J7J368_BUGNE|nr:CCS [Bugula neritina]
MAEPPVTTKVQLAVELAGDTCSNDIKLLLETNKGIKNVAVNIETQTVIVETVLSTNKVVDLIESSGNKAIVTGVGAAGSQVLNLGSAVAIMHEGNPSSGVRGVTRIVQSTEEICVIEGTLDGLSPNLEHRLSIHEYGDVSNGCDSCGDIFVGLSNLNSQDKHLYGDLGKIQSNNLGRSNFRIQSERVKVWDIIGRSMLVSSPLDSALANKSENSGWTKIACGIIARSAGIFENFKKICACDGTTLWDEYTLQQNNKSSPNSHL